MLAIQDNSGAHRQLLVPFVFRDNAVMAHIISPAVGAKFAMYLAQMSSSSSAEPAAADVERWAKPSQTHIAHVPLPPASILPMTLQCVLLMLTSSFQ